MKEGDFLLNNERHELLGTDVSIDVCIAEGYMMMEYNPSDSFDRTVEYRVLRCLPEYDNLAGELETDKYITFDELIELYEQEKEGIDSYSETHIHVNFENPDYGDFLNLADDVAGYMGLY